MLQRLVLRVLADLHLVLRMQCLLLRLRLPVVAKVAAVAVEMRLSALLLCNASLIILWDGRLQARLGWPTPLPPIVYVEELDGRRAAAG